MVDIEKMIHKNLNEITQHDLEDLITNQTLERKTLEYKRSIPSNSDSEKKEFLADVSSFANASGGDLIYGISQSNKTGLRRDEEGSHDLARPLIHLNFFLF